MRFFGALRQETVYHLSNISISDTSVQWDYRHNED